MLTRSERILDSLLLVTAGLSIGCLIKRIGEGSLSGLSVLCIIVAFSLCVMGRGVLYVQAQKRKPDQ